ncbi:MAG: helicase [Bacilli bacterium]|nr:helicase [Bacilli bacterium]
MNPVISLNTIKQLCGTTSYQRGEAYYQANRVTQLRFDQNESRYDAQVLGRALYHVSVAMDDYNGDVEADCDCPAFDTYSAYCKHIAAVLVQIHSLNQGGNGDGLVEPAISRRDMQLTNDMISLFDSPVVQMGHSDDVVSNKQLLDVEFTCKVITHGAHSSMFAMEMKLGPKRLYIVQKIKDFLAKLDKQSPYFFAKNFTFDSAEHAFKQADWAIIELLIEACQNESIYREAFNNNYSMRYGLLSSDRLIVIPPLTWEKLHPYLSEATVRFGHGSQVYEQIEITDEPLPLSFELTEASDGYQLDIPGLDSITVMENYGCAQVGHQLHRIEPSQFKRLVQVKHMFHYRPLQQLLISPSQMGTFMERVIPGLKKVGSIHISKQISDRILNLPLQIKLYLDIDDSRLSARLEYVYGDIVINPMHSGSERLSSSDRILLRDIEQERYFISLIDHAFNYDGKELHMDQEEDIYHFLHHLLPRIEELAEVFVTPSVQSLTRQNLYQPKMTVDIDSKTNWLEIHFDLEGIDEHEISSILRTLVEKKHYYRLTNGTFLSLEEDRFQEIGRLLQEMNIRKAEIKGTRLELPVVRGFHFMDANEKTPAVKLGKSLRQLLENMKNPDNLDFELPEQLSFVMRDYQKYGFQWMKTLGFYGFGGILADDMGLGKTLQSIAFIQSEQQAIREAGVPALIVCPASLTYNWKNEIAKFAPDLTAVIAAGDRQERSGILDDLSNVDILITSYPLLRRDMEKYEQLRFHTLIVDEAQAIKNHHTQTAQAVKVMHAKHRFALTGTPVENSLEELWSIYDAVFPELFPSKKGFNELSREAVAKKIRPFLLRRMKTDVLKELPDKIETLQPAELSVEQKKLYLAYLARLQAETIQQLQMEGLQKSRMKILAGLTRLRQLCCHPSLFVENYTGSSGKFEQLMEIIEECLSGGKRMLIFSQFTQMLGIIRNELERRGLSAFYLDGHTPPIDRVELCRRFNEGEQDIFLISLKAGGTGLNLTGADTVVLYDLWWNPAVEQQATDRAHRIGQKNVVQVIRLVTQGTIEEKMYELQQRKKDLINEVIQPGEEALSSLTEQEIRELLMIG